MESNVIKELVGFSQLGLQNKLTRVNEIISEKSKEVDKYIHYRTVLQRVIDMKHEAEQTLSGDEASDLVWNH